MIWYFDQFGHTFYGSDLYGRQLSSNTSTPVYFFREERICRYSGSLYTKLNSIINIMYNNVWFAHVNINCDGDNGYFITIRFESCKVVYQRTRKLFTNGNPIVSGEFYSKLYYHPNPYFIDN